MGDYFYFSHLLEVNNCWMVVDKDVLKNEAVNLELTVYNRAMESTSFKKTVITIIDFIHAVDNLNHYYNTYKCIFSNIFNISFQLITDLESLNGIDECRYTTHI